MRLMANRTLPQPSNGKHPRVLHGRPRPALRTIRRVRVLGHVKKLDDCFGQVLVRAS